MMHTLNISKPELLLWHLFFLGWLLYQGILISFDQFLSLETLPQMDSYYNAYNK